MYVNWTWESLRNRQLDVYTELYLHRHFCFEWNAFDGLTLSFVGRDLCDIILVGLHTGRTKALIYICFDGLKYEVIFLRNLNSKLSFSEIEIWVKFRSVCERLKIVSPCSEQRHYLILPEGSVKGQEAGRSPGRREGWLSPPSPWCRREVQ